MQHTSDVKEEKVDIKKFFSLDSNDGCSPINAQYPNTDIKCERNTDNLTSFSIQHTLITNIKEETDAESGISLEPPNILFIKEEQCSSINLKTEKDLADLDQQEITCKIGDAKLKTKSRLRKHCTLKNHTKTHLDEYKFECNICHLKFKRKDNFNSHLLIHSDNYSFKCNICEAKFKQKRTLSGHLLTHSDRYPFECEFCHLKLKRKDHLKKHLLLHSDTYAFNCEFCPAKFKQKQGLKSHLLRHSDKRAFECDICHSKFKRSDHLNTHSFIHLDSCGFECHLCKAKFKLKDYLIRHLKTHSNQRRKNNKIN